MLSTIRRSAKARWPLRFSFALPILKSRRSSRLSRQRNVNSKRMSTMRLFTVLTHPGDVCTRRHRIQFLITAPSKFQHQLAPCNGALNHRPLQFRRRKYLQSTPSMVLPLMTLRYAGYPHSVLSNNRAPNGVLASAIPKSNADAGPGPARHATHVKIESPSVTAAAKKAAAENVQNEAPDAGSSTTSDEDTLVCKSKSSKSYGPDEVVLSPTKSKL